MTTVQAETDLVSVELSKEVSERLGLESSAELGRGEAAYLKALGLTKEDIDALVSEIRAGFVSVGP